MSSGAPKVSSGGSKCELWSSKLAQVFPNSSFSDFFELFQVFPSPSEPIFRSLSVFHCFRARAPQRKPANTTANRIGSPEKSIQRVTQVISTSIYIDYTSVAPITRFTRTQVSVFFSIFQVCFIVFSSFSSFSRVFPSFSEFFKFFKFF